MRSPSVAGPSIGWVEEGRLEGAKIGRGSLRVFHTSLDRLVQNNKTQEMNLTV